MKALDAMKTHVNRIIKVLYQRVEKLQARFRFSATERQTDKHTDSTKTFCPKSQILWA